jgi:sialic acid synthase SpsE
MRIIADAGANHLGDRRIMEVMIKAVAKAGVEVIKFQSWRANKLRKDWPDYEKEVEYYQRHELSEEDHYWLLERCKENNIEFLTTVFDLETVNFLAGLGLERVKIASPDCNSWRLIDKCLAKFDHVIISTGAHALKEVEALREFLGDNTGKVTVLHCVSLYPTPPDKVNMLRLRALFEMFPSVGFSDHTLGLDAAKLALSLGVACIERHYTLNRHLPGKDQYISSTPEEFAELVAWREKVQTMMYCPDVLPDMAARKYVGRWGDNA